jgi:hypothetical protein
MESLSGARAELRDGLRAAFYFLSLPELIRGRRLWNPFVAANLALPYSVTWLALTYRQIA